MGRCSPGNPPRGPLFPRTRENCSYRSPRTGLDPCWNLLLPKSKPVQSCPGAGWRLGEAEGARAGTEGASPQPVVGHATPRRVHPQPSPTNLLQPLRESRGQYGWEMEQEGLLSQLSQGRHKPAGVWVCTRVGATAQQAEVARQSWRYTLPGPSTLLGSPPAPHSALCKALLHPTHWSLQMQMMGLIRSPPSARCRRPPLVGTPGPPDSASCGPLWSRMFRRTLMAA